MRRRLIVGCVLSAAVVIAPTAGSADAPREFGSEPVEQVGTYGYLSSPDYTGLAPIGRIVRRGSIGLGTFNGIDGEMVVLGGTAYRVGTDGRPRVVSTKRTTPFAQAVVFRPEFRERLDAGTSCADLGPAIDRLVDSSAGIVATKITGRFRGLQMRSVPAQRAPYPPLSDVVAEQSVFDLDGARATLVGFRSGPDTSGLSAPGVHLHGLTRDRRAGGHVLSCRTGRGVIVRVQRPDGIHLHLPRP